MAIVEVIMRPTTLRPHANLFWLFLAVISLVATSCGDSTGESGQGPEARGIEPVGVYLEHPNEDGEPTPSGTFFFDNKPDDVIELIGNVTNVAQSEEGQSVQSTDIADRLAEVDNKTEFVMVVARGECAPSRFELTSTEEGFTHTTWREPVSCVWAPIHAAVYVVPRVSATGVEYSEGNWPEVAYETIEADG